MSGARHVPTLVEDDTDRDLDKESMVLVNWELVGISDRRKNGISDKTTIQNSLTMNRYL